MARTTTLREALYGTDAEKYLDRHLVNNTFLNNKVRIPKDKYSANLRSRLAEKASDYVSEKLYSVGKMVEDRYPSGFKRWFLKRYGFGEPFNVPGYGPVRIEDSFEETLRSYYRLADSVASMAYKSVDSLFDSFFNGSPWVERDTTRKDLLEGNHPKLDDILAGAYEYEVKPALEDFSSNFVKFSSVLVRYLSFSRNLRRNLNFFDDFVEEKIRNYASSALEKLDVRNLGTLLDDAREITSYFLDFTDSAFGLVSSSSEGDIQDRIQNYSAWVPSKSDIVEKFSEALNNYDLKSKIETALGASLVREYFEKLSSSYFGKKVLKKWEKGRKKPHPLVLAKDNYLAQASELASVIEGHIKTFLAEYARRLTLPPETQKHLRETNPMYYYKANNRGRFNALKHTFSMAAYNFGNNLGLFLYDLKKIPLIGKRISEKTEQKYGLENGLLAFDFNFVAKKILNAYDKVMFSL